MADAFKPVMRVDLKSADARAQIEPLHAALQYFCSAQPPVLIPLTVDEQAHFDAEKQQPTAPKAYGDMTKKLVNDYRTKVGIGASVEVDDLAAARMSMTLAENGQLAGYGITGIVATDSEGKNGVQGITLRAYNYQGAGEGKQLGKLVHSGVAGRYAIFFEPEDTKPINVFVGAFGRLRETNDTKLAETPVVLAGLSPAKMKTEVQSLQVPAEVVPIEYDLISKIIEANKKSLGLPNKIEEFTDANVRVLKLLPEFVTIPMEAIEHFVLSSLLTADVNRFDLHFDPQFFYAFLRTDALLFTLWTIPPEAQTSLHLIDMQREKEDPNKARREEQIAKIAFYSTIETEKCDEADVQSVVNAAVDRRYIEWSYPEQEPVDGDNYSRKLASLRKAIGQGPIKELRKAIATRYPQAKKPTDPRPPLRGFRVLASGDLFLCHGVGGVEDPFLKSLYDDGKLSPKFTNVCKTILDGKSREIPAFVSFGLQSGNAYALAADQHWDRDQTSLLLALQRVVKLTVALEEIKFLLDENLGSAWQVRILGKSAFIARYIKAMGGIDNPDIELKASVLFDKAARAAETTSHLAGEARALMTAQHVEALSPRADQTRLRAMLKSDDAGQPIPSWEQLFGSLDACGCDECQSILGPGSYLVDVLQYFKRLSAKPHEGKERSAFDVLMRRRPDLGYIDISCANAMTEVPYIDMVCELLEDEMVRSNWSVALQLEPGKKISKDDLAQLRSLGHPGGDKAFPDLTDQAWVSSDSLGCRLVRDERLLVLCKPLSVGDRCTQWGVARLHQTYGSAEEVGAAPEYVNQNAVDTLKESDAALALPFDADRIEAVAYLDKMDTDRATAIGDLAKWPSLFPDPPPPQIDPEAMSSTMVSELLGLTKRERELITRATNPEWAPDDTLRRFLDKTGLKTEPVGRSELDELLAGKFINPCGQTLKIVSDDPNDVAGRCDTAKMRIDGLNGCGLDRVLRLLRLWRKLKWPLNLLDRLIESPSIGGGKLDPNCLAALAQIVHLARAWKTKPETVAVWFADVSTYGEHSEYQRIFLQNRDNGQPYEAFRLVNLCPDERCLPPNSEADCGATGDSAPCETVETHKAALARCLGVADDQLQCLLHYCGTESGGDPLKLSLKNMSRIRGWFSIARKLKLRMQELTLLLGMLGIPDVVAGPVDLRKLYDALELMRRWGFKVADIRFWLLHQFENDDEARKRVIPDFAIAKVLSELRKRFDAIKSSRPAKKISVWHSKDDPGDDQAACLDKLNQALSNLKGFTTEQTVQLTALLQHRRANTGTDTQDLQRLMTDAKASALAVVSGVADLAAKPPVNGPGDWVQSGTEASSYQSWVAELVDKVLDQTDDTARDDAIIAVIAEQTKAPLEQIDCVVRRCRMPGDAGPSKGPFILDILKSGAWTTPDNAIKSVYEGIFVTTQDALDALEQKARDFRGNVVNGRPIESWIPLSDFAVAEQWRKLLGVCFIAVRLVHKIVGLAKTLKLDTETELNWGLEPQDDGTNENKNRFQRLDWMSVDEIPLVELNTGKPNNYPQWVRLLEGLETLNAYPMTPTPADPNLKQGAATAMELALRRKASVDDIVAICYQLFGSADLYMLAVAKWLGAKTADFCQGKAYVRLKKACELVQRIGISTSGRDPKELSDDLDALTADIVARPLALMLRQCLKQQSDPNIWLQDLKAIQDPIRDAKRDALVAYLTATRPCYKEVNDLYDHFLIDPQMCSCMPTSRIVQAHATVQLFAQRCLMGLEPDVDLQAEAKAGDDWKEWPWMRNYRVWQANRKVFLYPENWIEPELRDDKSQFFKELEQTLQQSDLNDFNIETAARAYLDKLDDAAFMEVMAVHYQDTDFSENGKIEGKVLHVVARTKGGDPAKYFYRRFVKELSWTPWESIDLDIATDHILLFMRNGRLNIAWPVFADVVDESAKLKVPQANANEPSEIPKAPRGWTIQLAMSERSNGQWQPKRVSKDAITSDKVKASAARMAEERMRTRFFILDREPRDYFLAREDDNFGFYVAAYGFLQKFTEEGETKDQILPKGAQKKPQILGAFNLAGCKGFPEVVSNGVLGTLTESLKEVVVPRVRDSELIGQRWVEQNSDGDNFLVVEGAMANNLAELKVFNSTPGTFKVTTAQQGTLVDQAIIDGLTLLRSDQRLVQQSQGWTPGGVTTPFFYEDGRRGYIAVPSIRQGGAMSDVTISGLLEHISVLHPKLHIAADSVKPRKQHEDKKPPETWSSLVDNWGRSGTEATALENLKGKLTGCFGLSFEAFYHPYVCKMKFVLAMHGFEGLMKLSPIDPRPSGSRMDEFKELYGPVAEAVLSPYPAETSGFSFDSRNGYASYNWEVFYHLPSLISQKMVADQKYEESLRWFHFVFNPTGSDAVLDGEIVSPSSRGQHWITKPFRQRNDVDNPFDMESYVGQRIETILQLLDDPDNVELGNHWKQNVDDWRKNPFLPHQIARGRTVAFQKATVMRYLDALIGWGDFLFRQDGRENVNAALQLYVTAERLLGPRPRVVEAPGVFRTQTYRELEALIFGERPWDTPADQAGGIDPFGNSLVQLENFLPPQHGKPDLCVPCPPSIPAGSLLSVPYFCIPRNNKLMGYWDTVADRLYKIRHCENIEGVERKLALFAPPIDPSLLVRAVAAGISIGDVLAQGAGETPNYRFQTLASKATELVQLVISLGNSLLQAIEKRDAEALSNLRSTHELTLSKLVREIKLQQVQEALHALAGLEATKRTTETRRNFYRDVKYTSGGEELALNLNEEGSRFETAALALNTAANIFHMLPNFKIGGWGFGGAPGTDAEWGGVNLGNAASAMGQFIGGLGSLKRAAAGGVGTQASYARRWDEWKLQERLADLELAQMEHQIEAARIRVEINKAELRDHDKQIEQQLEVLAFMKDRKFSNQDLYDWMVGKISASYFQAWQMAYRFALRVERAFHFEFGEQADGTTVSYVRNDSWDSLHKGLLAGDRLLLDIKRMEVDYLDRNRRELELTKHISLARLKPDAFWKLKKDGKCDFELPDWLFDLDYPGHYFRRIKSVSLSIPCVVGPYANVNCTLTLKKNKIRIKPEMAEGEGDDENLLLNFARIQSIATSSGQNDSGLFEVNFRDERFLPFEGAGAESTWTLELPKADNRQIDRSTLTDVILHLKFTARDGGKKFQKVRRDKVKAYLNEGYPDGDKTSPIVQRLFLVKDEFPGEWHRFATSTDANPTLSLDGLKDRLPYFLPNLPKDNAAATVTMLMPDEKDLGKFSLGEHSGPSWEGVTFGRWDFTYDKPTKPSELGLLVSVMMEEDQSDN